MYYLLGKLRTFNSVRNEMGAVNCEFRGWGECFEIPLSDRNYISLIENGKAEVKFSSKDLINALISGRRMGICMCCVIPDSLELVENHCFCSSTPQLLIPTCFPSDIQTMVIPFSREEVQLF